MIDQADHKWSYLYDPLGQVVSARKSDAEKDLPGYGFGYTFDDIGNRLTSTTNERTGAYQSDALNRYTQRNSRGGHVVNRK